MKNDKKKLYVFLQFSAILRVFCETDKRYRDYVYVKVVEQVEYYDFAEDTKLLSLISYAINDKQKLAFFAIIRGFSRNW